MDVLICHGISQLKEHKADLKNPRNKDSRLYGFRKLMHMRGNG
jgi:hypothetical protein